MFIDLRHFAIWASFAMGSCVSAQVISVSGGIVPGELHCPLGGRHFVGRGALPKGPTVSQRTFQPNPPLTDSMGLTMDKATEPSRRPSRIAFTMAVWGDSHTASGSFIDALLDSYHLPANRVLPSFIPASFGLSGVRLPLRKVCISGDWQTNFAHRAERGPVQYSIGLVSISSDRSDSSILLDFRWPSATTTLTGLDVHFSKDDDSRTLVLGITVDDGPEKIVALSEYRKRVLRIQPDRPISTVGIRVVAGQFTLHGLAPFYQSPPVAVVDLFSLPGAAAKGWLNVDLGHITSLSASLLDYDLVIFQYGTNEGTDPSFRAEPYAKSLRASLAQLRRVFPRSRCVLIGPPDRGVTSGKTLPHRLGNFASTTETPLKLSWVHHSIGEVQKRVGKEFDCAFWDWQAAMSGLGGAYRWASASDPLIQPDLTHLTSKGYETSGRAFAMAFPRRPK